MKVPTIYIFVAEIEYEVQQLINSITFLAFTKPYKAFDLCYSALHYHISSRHVIIFGKNLYFLFFFQFTFRSQRKGIEVGVKLNAKDVINMKIVFIF